MTQATFVRLDTADLAEMAKRLGAILTDEGAHAWYKHDVAELLQEVVALRQEREAALASFREHDPLEGVPDSLPTIAAAWREQVTGLWEKAQVKKLRAETVQAKLEVSDLTGDLAVSERNVRELAEARDSLHRLFDSTVREHEQQTSILLAERMALTARIHELEAQVSTLMDEKATEQERVATMVKAVEDAYISHALKAKHLLLEAQTVLGT